MGSSRTSPSKGERRADRKQRRQAEARQNHRDKEKARDEVLKEERKANNERKPRPANYRRDADGNIILFGNIKISKVSGVIFGIIIAISAFFGIVSTGVGDMEYDTISYDACVILDFNDAMCMLEYKHCKTFADGKTICEYAEESPWTDVKSDETKWAPEEQDFLPPARIPPTDFIMLPFVQYAEARGADEPDCYTCKDKGEADKVGDEDNLWARNQGLTPEEQLALELPTPDEANKTVKELRQEIDDLELEFRELEREVQLWILEEAKLKNERFTAESAFEDEEDDFKDAKKKYIHAMDMKPRTTDDIHKQTHALKEFKVAARELEVTEKQYTCLLYTSDAADE